MHRRTHLGVDKIRSLPHVSSDAPRIRLPESRTPCVHCAAAQIKKSSHSGHMNTPSPSPGVLHTDLKQLKSRSSGGALYAMYFIDEHTRYVWVEFLKAKSDVTSAALRVIAKFNASVGVEVDNEGRPLPRPKVRRLRSDHEGGLISHAFAKIREERGLDNEHSAPNDHDLNGIAERTIGVIDELSVAIKAQGGIPDSYWPYVVRHAVNVHNCTATSVGSSSSDPSISAHQRFTLQQPKVMDLAPPGVRAVVLKPPTHRSKGDLEPRGWIGCLLGRSTNSIDCWDVAVGSGKVVSSSSVVIDEEYYPWRKNDERQPIPPASKPAPHPTAEHL